ncbi:HNH endonuclease [Micromonospora sp. DT201]|uniref:HNH endonuclease n=1 Tax=Micromonospora sp. DT201 TaxID=3393442 RepID=UPI003CEF606D
MTKEQVLAQPPDAKSCCSCGISIAGKRSNARFCNRTCKAAGFQTANRVRLRGKDRARYPKEAAKRRADAKAYYGLNAEQRRAYAVRWRKENPHRRRNQQDRRVDLMLSNPGFVAFGEAEWQELLRQYDHRCVYCGIRSDRLEKDHVIPLTRGGRHAISNILPACKGCNISKYDHLLVEWRYARRKRHAPQIE